MEGVFLIQLCDYEHIHLIYIVKNGQKVIRDYLVWPVQFFKILIRKSTQSIQFIYSCMCMFYLLLLVVLILKYTYCFFLYG